MAAFKASQNVYVELPEDNAMAEASTQQTRPRVSLLIGCPSRFALHHFSCFPEMIGSADAVVE